MQVHTVYGVTLATDFAFSWPVVACDPRPGEVSVDLSFTCAQTAPVQVDWDEVAAVHAVGGNAEQTRPAITYHALGPFDVIRIRGVADHYLWEDRIVCHLHDPTLAYLVEIQLLGIVLALWLERRGVPTLHASAGVIDGRAIAFLATKGGGKTTAVLGLIAAGHALLADDLLALRPIGTAILAQPGYPMLRLWPEQADHLVGGHADLPLVHPGFVKRRLTVAGEIGTFHCAPAPLERIYLPRRMADGAVTIEPVRSADAVIAMVQHSFLRDATHRLGLAGLRLQQFADALRWVEVRMVRYPTGYDHLAELAEAIEADLSAG